MTHAALKDLENKWRAEAATMSIYWKHATERCADQLSAALSAVEAVAVQWQMRRTSTVTGDWLDWRECEETTYAEIQAGEWANPDVNYESRALYTAPPPQQAGEVVVTTDESGRCVMVSRQDDEHRILKVLWEAPTRPTPSPGPQGGGDAQSSEADELLRSLGLDPERFRSDGGHLNPGRIKAAILHPEDYSGLYLSSDHLFSHSAKLGGETCERCGAVKNTRRGNAPCLATPPAHQPGEVVTDEMVERAAKAMCADDHDADGNTEKWWADAMARHEYLRYARINLTAALAPKEDGHG